MAAGHPVTAPGDDHLVFDQEANYPKTTNDAGVSFSWLTIFGFLFLSFSSAMAIMRSEGDMTDIAYVAFSNAVLVALFVCLRMYDRARAGSSRREWLKVAVWTLTTLLTLAFCSKVAVVMPAAAAAVVCLMAFTITAGSFVALFIYKEQPLRS